MSEKTLWLSLASCRIKGMSSAEHGTCTHAEPGRSGHRCVRVRRDAKDLGRSIGAIQCCIIRVAIVPGADEVSCDWEGLPSTT